MKKLFNLLLIGFSFIVSGCQKESHPIEKDNHQARQVLRVNNQGDLVSLHPHMGIDLQCRIFQKALFEGLTRIGLDSKPYLSGALKVDISPCQKIYTFTLRPMFWTNGEKVTAYHFEKSWKKALLPSSSCLRTDLFYPIKNAQKVKTNKLPVEEVKIHAQDENTLIIELEHPTPYFLNLLANPLFSPLYDDETTPKVFNGPFKVALWEHDKQLILDKNENYWDASSVRLNRIEVSQVRDANTALLMYEKNELDWIGHPFTHLPLDALEKAALLPEFISKPIAGVYWMSLNTEAFPLNSSNIRKALSISLDRKNIAKHVLMGETPAKSIVPTGLALLKEDELYKDNDIALAKSYFEKGLRELNLTLDNFPKLVLEHSDVPGQKKLAEAIQEKWQSIFGINVELVGSEWNVFFSNLNRKQFHIAGCIWFCFYHDPIYTLDFFRNRGQCYNTPGWENPYFQKLLDLADEETNTTLRNLHLKQAETLILEEMPIIPLFVFNSKHLKARGLQNLVVNDLGYVDFKWAYFE